MIYKLLAILLEYPTQELSEHWSEIEAALSTLDSDDSDSEHSPSFSA